MLKIIKPILTAVMFLQFYSSVYSQAPVRQITLDLNPIAIENGKYFFNGKRVTFDGLLIPLQAVDDRQVNRYIKTSLTLRTTTTVVRIGLASYLLYLIADQPPYVNYHQTRTLVLSSVAAGFSLNITEKFFQRKAVKRFNAVVLSR